MKKLLSILLILALAFSFAACDFLNGNDETPGENEGENNN
jgi:hypothetical protein